jgi:hypothetical protein
MLKDIQGISQYITGAGTSCPNLLPVSATPRTILKAWIITNPNDATTINSILIGENLYLQSNSAVNSFVEYSVVSSNAISCTRQKDKATFYAIAYLPYEENETTGLTTIQEIGTIKITDGSYSAYISPKVDFGDLFIMGFLILFTGALIFKFVWDFVNPKVVKIKSQQM